MNTDQFDNSMPPEYLEKDAKAREVQGRNSIDLDDDENDLDAEDNSEMVNRRSRARREPKSSGKPWLSMMALIVLISFLAYRFLYQPANTAKDVHTFGSNLVTEAKKFSEDLEHLSPPNAIEKLPIDAPKVTAVDISGGNTPKESTAHLESMIDSIRKNQELQMEILKDLKEASTRLEEKQRLHEDYLKSLTDKISNAPKKQSPSKQLAEGVNTLPKRTKPTQSKITSTTQSLIAPVKPAVVFPDIRVTSIKNYNGKAGANLYVRGEPSPFILVGQNWNGITLVGADTSTRSVSIEYFNEIRSYSL